MGYSIVGISVLLALRAASLAMESSIDVSKWDSQRVAPLSTQVAIVMVALVMTPKAESRLTMNVGSMVAPMYEGGRDCPVCARSAVCR